MNDWKKRRDAIAWAQREVSRQMGIAGAAKDEKEVDRLVEISAGLTAAMEDAERFEGFKAMVRGFV